MDILPAIDPAGNSIRFSALPTCRCVQLDRDLLLHVLHINGVSHCVVFPWHPQVRPPLAPGPARRSSGTCFRRLRRRRRILAVSAVSYAGINILTYNSCQHQLSWCNGPTCWSGCARYWVQYRNYAMFSFFLKGQWIC